MSKRSVKSYLSFFVAESIGFYTTQRTKVWPKLGEKVSGRRPKKANKRVERVRLRETHQPTCEQDRTN